MQDAPLASDADAPPDDNAADDNAAGDNAAGGGSRPGGNPSQPKCACAGRTAVNGAGVSPDHVTAGYGALVALLLMIAVSVWIGTQAQKSGGSQLISDRLLSGQSWAGGLCGA